MLWRRRHDWWYSVTVMGKREVMASAIVVKAGLVATVAGETEVVAEGMGMAA